MNLRPARSSLSREVGRHWVELLLAFCVDVDVIRQMAANWVVGDVRELVLEVFGVADAVLMEAGLPYSAGKFGSKGVGESALDALSAAFYGLIRGRSQEDVNALWHDDESM
jgi:hypothetical protein